MSPENIRNLIGLLRREGRYSGVWFAEHLLNAADLLEKTLPEIEEIEK